MKIHYLCGACRRVHSGFHPPAVRRAAEACCLRPAVPVHWRDLRRCDGCRTATSQAPCGCGGGGLVAADLAGAGA